MKKLSRSNIDNLVEEYRDDIIESAQELVQISSENIAPKGYEKASQEYLQSLLEDIDAEVDIFNPMEVKGIKEHEAYFEGRDYSNRPNIVASRKGEGNGRSLILSNHVDVVTAKPEEWESGDPYSGKIENGKLYGRGSFDMKGALISTLFVLKILSEHNIQLKGDLYFESVVDEENAGSNGTLASRIRGHNADAAIIPEPTMLDICPAAKGGRQYKVSISGTAGTDYGGEELLNPVYDISYLIQAVEEYEKHINEDLNPDDFFSNQDKPRTVILDKVQAGELREGGNIAIPDQAWFSVFINSLLDYEEPHQLDEELFNFLDKNTPDRVNPEYTRLTRYLYPFKSDPAHPVVDLLSKNVGTFTNQSPNVTGAKFACDGFIFKNFFDTETYVFGPRGGNAHAPDEYVETDDLVNLTKIFLDTAINWCNKE